MAPSRPRSSLIAAALAVLAPVLLVAGLWFGGHPEHLPGFVREAFVSEKQSNVVEEAIQRIAQTYYRPIPVGKLSDASISGAVASLDDRFSHYLSPSEFREFTGPPHFAGIGVVVDPEPRGLLVVRVFDNSPAQRARLSPGELIVAAGGRRLQGLSPEQATALIRGEPGTEVTLQIESGPGGHKRTRTVTLTRETVSEPVVASLTRTVDGRKLGVVALASFSEGAHGEVREAVESELHEHVEGVVLDLRGNGGGLVEEAQLIASIFVPKGVIVSMRGRTQHPQTLMALGDAIPASVPVVVLVDSNTASSAEIVTAALQDHHRATVVGTHTFGKGVFQEEEPLSNGGALDITVGEFFTPDGRNLGGGGVKQGAGVIPEVKVPANVVDTQAGLQDALDTLAAKAG